MELSADNIEELVIAMASNPENIDFHKKSNPSNLVMDTGVVDIQDCILKNSLETIGSYSGSCSFNDIYSDICDMSNIFELETSNANTTNSQFTIPQTTEIPISSPSFFHMPDINLQGEYTPDCSFSNQAEFLQPLDIDIQWAEYQSNPTSEFVQIQDVVSLPTPPIAPLSPAPTPTQLPSPIPETTPLNVNISPQLSSSTPVGPVQIFTNCNLNFSPEQPQIIQQSNTVIPTAQVYYPMENNVNFLMLNEPAAVSLKKKVHRFDWARVVPRKEIVRPFRTRKIKSSRSTFDLASYFDTSTIIIPMIRERPRCKNAYRRKQKLHTIPRADNLKFEVESAEKDIEEDDKCIDLNNNKEELYPETEIPELDEIFKRKRRGLKTCRTAQRVKTPTCFFSKEENDVMGSLSSPQKQIDEIESNDSDLNSDDSPLIAVRTLKCQHCQKFFKTGRSLTIHLKRCDAVRQTLPSNVAQPRCIRKASTQSSSSKENADVLGNDVQPTVEQRSGTRPLTRSQTNAAKRKAEVSGGSCIPKKRLK